MGLRVIIRGEKMFFGNVELEAIDQELNNFNASSYIPLKPYEFRIDPQMKRKIVENHK